MKEFRAFILRGNVLDLAVGVVIGAAFGAIVSSFVGDILTPLLGLLNVPDFKDAAVKVGSAEVRYGRFINAALAFLMISSAVFFLVVKPVNHLMERMKTEPDVDSPTKNCPFCISSIPVQATKCAFCGSEV